MHQNNKSGPPIKLPLKVTTEHGAIQEVREEERRARYEQVLALREQGLSYQSIADHLGMGHSTVQRWLKKGQCPHRKAREQLSQLDPFLPSIQLRQSQGYSTMVQLHQIL